MSVPWSPSWKIAGNNIGSGKILLVFRWSRDIEGFSFWGHFAGDLTPHPIANIYAHQEAVSLQLGTSCYFSRKILNAYVFRFVDV